MEERLILLALVLATIVLVLAVVVAGAPVGSR